MYLHFQCICPREDNCLGGRKSNLNNFHFVHHYIDDNALKMNIEYYELKIYIDNVFICNVSSPM